MTENTAGVWKQTIEKLRKASLRLLPSHLQGKLIIPYVILTLLLATVGTYVITRLVASTFRERFVNQLYDASRVAADGIVRRERTQLEYLRLMAFTEGVPQAFSERDVETLQDLLLPVAVNGKIDVVTAVNLDGVELFTLGLDPTSQKYLKTKGVDFSSFDPVRKVIEGVVDQQGDKYIGLMETAFGPTLLTSAPVKNTNDELVGVLLVGSRLETIVSEIRDQALAQLVILDNDHSILATTLARTEEDDEQLILAAQSLHDSYSSATQDLQLYGRSYQIIFSPLIARDQEFGHLGVVLPSNYVISLEATSRNTFAAIFTLATAIVIIIGYRLSQDIARPILRMRALSQAVAAGDLDQQINIDRTDEIGELADAFDQMTLHLRERTAEAARLYAETVKRNKELAEINVRLQSTQLQLIQSEKLAAMGQLTAGIVHDVKNPLAVIKGLAELLQSEEAFANSEEMHLIRESSVKADRIVSDLLKFARQSEPQRKYQDLREAVEASLRLTAYLIRKAHVNVIKDLPANPVFVCYDSQQIEQVLVNLIANAIQAMPAEGTLRISLKEADGAVALAVQDNGSGISPENLGKIFDPFFTTKPEGEGTGLGLSVSYGIVASHQGQIDVESELGNGTAFTILLPSDPQEFYKKVMENSNGSKQDTGSR